MNKSNSKGITGEHARPILKQIPCVDLPNEILVDLMSEVLEKGVKFRFCAKGKSMLPFIHDGDLITICPLSQEQPGLGKIAAYIHPVSRKLIVHRVVAIQGETFCFRGDNELSQHHDQVCANDILGCVTKIYRGERQHKIGLGLERYLIAYLSRTGWLTRIMTRLDRVIRVLSG